MNTKAALFYNNIDIDQQIFSKFILYYRFSYYGLITLNKPKSRQVYTNDGIITQNIFNAAVSTSVKLKTNTKKLYFCEYLIST